MIEDLHTVHYDIRTRAKKEDCERDLDVLKSQLLDYLNFLKKTP